MWEQVGRILIARGFRALQSLLMSVVTLYIYLYGVSVLAYAREICAQVSGFHF